LKQKNASYVVGGWLVLRWIGYWAIFLWLWNPIPISAHSVEVSPHAAVCCLSCDQTAVGAGSDHSRMIIISIC